MLKDTRPEIISSDLAKVELAADSYLLYPTTLPDCKMIEKVRENILCRDFADGKAVILDKLVDMEEFLQVLASDFASFDEMIFIKKLADKLGLSKDRFLPEPKRLDKIFDAPPNGMKLTLEQIDEIATGVK